MENPNSLVKFVNIFEGDLLVEYYDQFMVLRFLGRDCDWKIDFNLN
jgi:hypothetical protein